MTSFLNIREIERLAKAGVSIVLDTITPQSDPYEHNAEGQTKPAMARSVWDRWERNKMAMQNQSPYESRFVISLPFELLASRHGDKVWVSVHPTNFNYEPFQLQDDALVFPSDTLMASIALWEKEHPSA